MARKSGTRYFATSAFHYPDGVVAKGESAELNPAVAAPGIASGVLVEIEAPTPVDAPPSPKTEE